MKSISLFLLGSIFYFACSAQDYQVVHNNGIYYFEPESIYPYYGCNTWQDNYYHYHCIRVDSVATVDSTTLFYNLKELQNEYYTPRYGDHSIDDMDTGCFQPRISWIGEKFEIRPNGMNVFFNLNNDSIFVYTKSDQGDEWTFYRYPGGRYIKATHSLDTQMTFLGITDSVKLITFQEYDYTHLPMNSEINQLSIILSKDHGIIRTLNFRDFPGFDNGFGVMMWDLAGLPGNQEGAHLLTRREVFDFNVGDEFHYWGSLYQFPKKRIITGKTFSINNDTVTYQVNQRTWAPGDIPPDSFGLVEHSVDITETYTDLDSYVMPENLAPSEAFYNEDYYGFQVYTNYFMTNYCGGITAITTPGELFYENTACSWYYYPFEPQCIYTLYIKGCGKLAYDFMPDVGWDCSNCYDLVYINKGSFTCGSPITVYDIDEHSRKINNITLNPNPGDGMFSINGSNLQNSVSIRIFDLAGKMLYQKNQKPDELVDFRGHSQGLYFVQIISGDQVFSTILVIVE